MPPTRQLTAELAVRELISHGFPRIFVDILRGQHKRHCDGRFGLYFERPTEFYRLINESPEDFPYPETILPLHESNFDLFWCFVPDQGLFLQHSIEWKAEDHRVVATSLDAYLDYELERLCDEGIEPSDLRCIGTVLGHPEVDRVVAEYEASG